MKKLSKRVLSLAAVAVILATTLIPVGAFYDDVYEKDIESIQQYCDFDPAGETVPLLDYDGHHLEVSQIVSVEGDCLINELGYWYADLFSYIVDTTKIVSCSVMTSSGYEICYEFNPNSDVDTYEYLGTEINLKDLELKVGDSVTMKSNNIWLSSSNSSVVSVSGNTLTALAPGSAGVFFFNNGVFDCYYNVNITVTGSESVTKETIYKTVKSKERFLVDLDPSVYTYQLIHQSKDSLVTSVTAVNGNYAVSFGTVPSGTVESATILFKSAKHEYTYVYSVMGSSSGSSVVMNKVSITPGRLYPVLHQPGQFTYSVGKNEILNEVTENSDSFDLLFTDFTSLDPTYATVAFFPKNLVADRINMTSAKITASSNPGMNFYSGYPIRYMIDGYSSTRFASAGQKKTAQAEANGYWFVIDFGSEQTFDYIKSLDFKKNWKSWSFSTSADGVSWSAVDPFTVSCLYDQLISENTNVEFLFESPLTTRYLKIHVMHEEEAFLKGDTFSIWDLSFYKISEDSLVYVYDFELIPPGYVNPGDVDKKSPSYLQGQLDGYDAGYKSGKNIGYKQGYEEAKEYYTSGDLFKKAYDEGYAAARRDIVSVSDGNAISGFFQGIWSGLAAFVMPVINGIGFTSVDGTFISLGSIVTVLLVLTFVGFIVLLFLKK